MTSLAFGDLGGRLDEVKLLAKTDPARNGDVSQAPMTNALNRACVVLLCSHVEGFLEDLAVESLDALAKNQAEIHRLPVILRALHAEEHLHELEPIKDRNARAVRIEKMFKHESPLWVTGPTLTAAMLRPKMVCSKMSNPGSNDVRQFLELLGVDIESHLNAIGSLPLLQRINGLVGMRNAIAHGDKTTNPTYTDVDVYLSLVADLAREIDLAVALTVQAICDLPQLPW